MSSSISSGFSKGLKYDTTYPWLFTKNFAKFQGIFSPPKAEFALKNLNTGCAPAPFTSHFAIIGKVTPYLSLANYKISLDVPGSCAPN